MCVGICVPIHVRIHARKQALATFCINKYVYISVRVCIYVRMHACARVSLCAQNLRLAHFAGSLLPKAPERPEAVSLRVDNQEPEILSQLKMSSINTLQASVFSARLHVDP